MNRDELLEELQEQARLVGMGAERELALMAKVQRLERVNAELLEALEAIARGLETPQSDQLDGWTRAEAAQYARKIIAKAGG